MDTEKKLPILSDYLGVGDLSKIQTILDFVINDDPNIKYYQDESKRITKAIKSYMSDLQNHLSKS